MHSKILIVFAFILYIYIYNYAKLLTCIVCLLSSFTGVKRLLWFKWKLLGKLLRTEPFKTALKRHGTDLYKYRNRV